MQQNNITTENTIIMYLLIYPSSHPTMIKKTNIYNIFDFKKQTRSFILLFCTFFCFVGLLYIVLVSSLWSLDKVLVSDGTVWTATPASTDYEAQMWEHTMSLNDPGSRDGGLQNRHRSLSYVTAAVISSSPHWNIKSTARPHS